MSQKNDNVEYKMLLAKKWRTSLEKFRNSDEVATTRKALLRYGIKEPYVTNIIERLFNEAYKIISEP